VTVHGPVVTLLSRPGCHLCDQAREVIARVAADLGVVWEERDITASERDLAEYWDKIPVTLIDGATHDFWHVSEQRLRRALSGELSRPARTGAGPHEPLGPTLCKRSQGRTVGGQFVRQRARRSACALAAPTPPGASANVPRPQRTPWQPGHT
jgi:glutaredoxin-like protein DUF836